MMPLIAAALELANSVVTRLNIKLQRKYIEELTEIEMRLRELGQAEYLVRDHAAIDHWEFKLRQCLRAIAADARAENAVS